MNKLLLFSFLGTSLAYSTVSEAAGSSPVTAPVSVQLAKYCDCYVFKTANLPVFARSFNGEVLASYTSHEMQDCIGIKVDVDEDGGILKARVGPGVFTVAQLLGGPVYFGVRKKIAHAMELVNFDAHHGGILRFSYLKSFGVFDAFHDDFHVYDNGRKRASTAEELREVLNGERWGQMDLKVERSASKGWVLRDAEGREVQEILALMRGRQLMGLGIATGIADMVLSSEDDAPAYASYKCHRSRR